jgi:hypothetical protein
MAMVTIVELVMGSSILDSTMVEEVVKPTTILMVDLPKLAMDSSTAVPPTTHMTTPPNTLAHKPLLVTGRTLSHTTSSSLMDMVELSH